MLVYPLVCSLSRAEALYLRDLIDARRYLSGFLSRRNLYQSDYEPEKRVSIL